MPKSISKILFAIFLFIGPKLQAQEGNDALIQQLTANLSGNTRPEKMVEIGKRMLSKPYLAFTLEGPQEKLVCRLDGFDCYTFVETTLALAMVAELEKPTLKDFREKMQLLRYRHAEIRGYASRIHYFFEWAKHGEGLGVLHDLTQELGTHKPLKINFMSTHRQYYPAFKTDNVVWQEIKEMEKSLASYFFYEIKREGIGSVQNKIQTGDIVAFTSNVSGLDVNHVALAYWEAGKLKFIHASSELKKVVIADETISQYVKRITKHAGLMVVRVL